MGEINWTENRHDVLRAVASGEEVERRFDYQSPARYSSATRELTTGQKSALRELVEATVLRLENPVVYKTRVRMTKAARALLAEWNAKHISAALLER